MYCVTTKDSQEDSLLYGYTNSRHATVISIILYVTLAIFIIALLHRYYIYIVVVTVCIMLFCQINILFYSKIF